MSLLAATLNGAASSPCSTLPNYATCTALVNQAAKMADHEQSNVADASEEDMLKRMNGNVFVGSKQDLQPHGEGEYTFSNGTVYRGNFADGKFEGDGVLTFPDGGRFVSTWSQGSLVGGRYFFADGLEYSEKDWSYCTMKDRRFWAEHQGGIQLQQYMQLTDAGETSTKDLKAGTYDLGDCYLDPKDDRLYHYDGTYYRDPTPEELAWGKRKCRMGVEAANADMQRQLQQRQR